MTHIPITQGVLHDTAPMNWNSQSVLFWRRSNTLDGEVSVETRKEGVKRHGAPEIFNTDQSRQFTGHLWTDFLQAQEIRIAMNSKGRWMDNVFVERLWRSMKYECVYLDAFENVVDAHRKILTWIGYYNHERPESSLADFTPLEIHRGIEPLSMPT